MCVGLLNIICDEMICVTKDTKKKQQKTKYMKYYEINELLLQQQLTGNL